MSAKKKAKPEIPATPPNIDLQKEDIPPGYVLVKGQYLNARAKSLEIPFGLYYRKVNQWTRSVEGLVIREEDEKKWNTKPPSPRG